MEQFQFRNCYQLMMLSNTDTKLPGVFHLSVLKLLHSKLSVSLFYLLRFYSTMSTHQSSLISLQAHYGAYIYRHGSWLIIFRSYGIINPKKAQSLLRGWRISSCIHRKSEHKADRCSRLVVVAHNFKNEERRWVLIWFSKMEKFVRY